MKTVHSAENINVKDNIQVEPFLDKPRTDAFCPVRDKEEHGR